MLSASFSGCDPKQTREAPSLFSISAVPVTGVVSLAIPRNEGAAAIDLPRTHSPGFVPISVVRRDPVIQPFGT